MKSNNEGFSLLEILIYITVIAAVTLAIGSIFLSIAAGQTKADARAEINSNIRFITDKINQDISAASSVGMPAAAGQATATLSLTVGASTISYCVVNNQLRRSSSGICDGAAELLSGQALTVKNISFLRLENTNSYLTKTTVSIQTSLTLSYIGANQDSFTKQITSSLR
jgi:type II secretory pathway pseudopilin PulG